MTHEEAIREWISRRIRSRGHKTTRDDIRNVTYGIDDGFPGTDATPGDDPVAGIGFAWRDDRGHWIEGCYESLEHITPAELVQACLAIMEEPSQ